MRRLNPFWFAALLLAAGLVLWAALPASEDFTDTDGVKLTAHSASWTGNGGDMEIYSNSLVPDSAGTDNVRYLVHWNADTFDNDQWVEWTAASCYSYDHQVGGAVRVHASANTGYYAWCRNRDTLRIYKVVSGTTTQVGSTYSGSVPDGSVLKLTVQGTTLTLTQGGTTRITATDSAIASGYAGVNGLKAGGVPANWPRIDDWSAGDVSSAKKRVIIISFWSPLWSR